MSKLKKVLNSGVSGLIKILPVVLPIVFIVSSNSTASAYNGQPAQPDSLKQYRKF